MNTDWKEISINDLKAKKANAIAMGPFGSRIKKENFTDKGIPVIKGGNLNGDFILEEGFDYLTITKADELSTSNAFRRDIVITHRGTIGQVGIIPDNSKYERYVVSQSQLKVSLDESRVNPYFIYYFLRSPKGQHRLLSNASQVGVPAIAQASTSVKSILVPVPDLTVQNKIVEILLSLDCKIEANQQTNQTLESIAQALFKSWFVDFDPVRAKIRAKAAGRNPQRAAMAAIAGVSMEQDWDAIYAQLNQKLNRMSETDRAQLADTADLFPEEMMESELGAVPKGWDYSTIDKEFNIENGQSPPGSSYNEEGVGVPFYQGRTDFGFRFPTQRVFCTEPKRFAKKGDTLLSVRAPVGDLNIAIEDCCIGRGLASLRHKSGSISYTYYAMKKVQSQIESYEATGTVFGSINQKQLKALHTISPNDQVVNQFHEIVMPMDSNIMNKTFFNRELSELRDTLLPELIVSAP